MYWNYMVLFPVLVTLLFIGKLNGIVYLRSWNDRGPGAVEAGIQCLEQVEKLYFKNQSWQTPNIVIFHSKNLSAPAAEIELRYISSLHHRISIGNHSADEENSFQLKIISQDNSNRTYEGIMDVTLTDFYLIVADNKNTLSSTIRMISKTKSFNQRARYLILFNNPDQRNEGRRVACQFLNTLFTQYRAVNVVVLYANDAFSYDIYIGDPYGKHGKSCGNDGNEKPQCGKMKSIKAGHCNRGVLEKIEVTEDWLDMNKIPDEMGKDCVFNLCARIQQPFINQGCTSGLEISIMRFLQDVMGFEINTLCTDMDRGERQEDGSWTFLLEKVTKGECDIVAGALFPDFDTHEDFEATDFYLQDYYRFFVPKAQLAPRWKGLITIYDPDIWYAVMTIFIISWIFWFIVGIFSEESYQHRQFILISLNVICVTLGISANNRPEYTTLRFFFSILAIYSLILTTLYTSKLIDVFTNPMDDYQIDSIVEMLDIEIPLGGRLENMDWFDNGDELDYKIFKRYNFTENFRPSPKTIREIGEGQKAILVSQYYVAQTSYRDNVFGMTEELFSNHLEMLTDRGFPLIKRINKILGYFRDIGIMSKLFKDFSYQSNILTPLTYTKTIEIMRNNGELTPDLLEFLEEYSKEDEEDPEIELTPEHLQGPFTIWLLGLAISCIIFVLELIFNIEAIRNFCAKIWKPFGDRIEDIKGKFQQYFPVNVKKFEIKSRTRDIRFTPKKRRIIVFENAKRNVKNDKSKK